MRGELSNHNTTDVYVTICFWSFPKYLQDLQRWTNQCNSQIWLRFNFSNSVSFLIFFFLNIYARWIRIVCILLLFQICLIGNMMKWKRPFLHFLEFELRITIYSVEMSRFKNIHNYVYYYNYDVKSCNVARNKPINLCMHLNRALVH